MPPLRAPPNPMACQQSNSPRPGMPARQAAAKFRLALRLAVGGTTALLVSPASAGASTPLLADVPTLNQAGADRLLRDAVSRAMADKAPSAIAVVDGAGMLLAFIRMDGARPGSIELAMGKARSAALMRRPTSELEDNVAKGRTALATEGLTALRGGAPVLVHGLCVGAIGVAGLNKDEDAAISAQIANLAERNQ